MAIKTADRTVNATPDLSINLGGITFSNPFVAASGTYGLGRLASRWQDTSSWGGISTKGVTPQPKLGNPPPRIAETPSGMMNSVGLQNPGIDELIADELSWLLEQDTVTVVNVAGGATEDYLRQVEKLQATTAPIIELNLSCPNVAQGCMAFGANPDHIRQVVNQVKQITDKQLWVKLTPNVTSIAEAAQAAEMGGADAVSLINTVLALAIDVESRRPILRNNTGGLSGPAIKPLALRMVHEVYQAVKIPIVGMGGIMNATDAIEFMMAGASLVQLGTFNLVHPQGIDPLIADFTDWLHTHQIRAARDLTGTLQLWEPEPAPLPPLAKPRN